jgi:hypothetical protein
MIFFWGLKKIPLRGKIPALKDHLTKRDVLHEVKLLSQCDQEVLVYWNAIAHGNKVRLK